MEETVKTYLHFKSKYPDTLIFIRSGEYYYSFNTSAFTLLHLVGGFMTREVINNVLHFYTAKHHYQINNLMDKLKKSGYPLALIDLL